MNSKKLEYKRRQLQVVMYLLQRIFGRKAAQEILSYIKDRFAVEVDIQLEKKHPIPERRPHIPIQPQVVPVETSPWDELTSTVSEPASIPTEWTTTSAPLTWTETSSSTTDWVVPSSWRSGRD